VLHRRQIFYNLRSRFRALAGIQALGGAFPTACGVDSRLRGNDRTGGALDDWLNEGGNPTEEVKHGPTVHQ
jgi:hypothetical protein